MRTDGLRRSQLAKSRLTVELLEDRLVLSAATPVQIVDSSSTDYSPSSILVRFRPEVANPVGSAILQGTSVGRVVAPLLVPGLYEVDLTPGVSVPQAIAAYNASALVQYAEPNFNMYITDTIPNDPQWSQLNGMRRIQMPLAWDAWYGSGATIIASIDTGVDYNHPDLAGNMWPGIGHNFVNGTPNPLDDNGHGSHTSGTMAAIGNNGVGVVGVNWYAQIMALKVFTAAGSGQTSWAISALNYAVSNGAAVSNNSYGCQGCFVTSFQTALQTADAFGHIFVAAAGNSNRNTDVTPFYPANYAVGNVISVAATGTTNDARASFSNYGPNTVHIGAPGVNVRSSTRNGAYATMSGTSMAAPHVAGAMALQLDYFGYWGTPSDMRDWLMATADYVALPVISGGRLNVARLLGIYSPGGAPGAGDNFALVVRTLSDDFQTAAFGFEESLPPSRPQPLPIEATVTMRRVTEQVPPAVEESAVDDGGEGSTLGDNALDTTAYI